MKGIIPITLLTFLVCSCAATKTPHQKWKEKLADFNEFRETDKEPSSDYLEKFRTEARFLNTTVKQHTNEDGTIFYAFEPIKIAPSLPPLYYNVVTPLANERFANSCPGKVTSTLDMGTLYSEGLVTFDKYAPKDKLNELFQENWKKLLRFHYFEGERWRTHGMDYSDYYGLRSAVKSFLYGTALRHDNYYNMTIQREEGQLCIVDKQIHSLVAYGTAVRKIEGSDGRLKPVWEFSPLYVPPGSIEKTLQVIFNEGLAAHNRLLADKLKSKKRKQARNRARSQRNSRLQKFNSARREVWNNRLEENYIPGDMVCTENNVFGYVEQSNSENTKVLIKGVANNRPSMFFFGNSDIHLDESFQLRFYEEVKWFKNSSIAKCKVDF